MHHSKSFYAERILINGNRGHQKVKVFIRTLHKYVPLARGCDRVSV